MRKPKIGDIVLVHDEEYKDIWPAIVKKIKDDNSINVTCFSDGITNMFGLRHYCPTIERICWSWPEEEKQCENTNRKMIVELHNILVRNNVLPDTALEKLRDISKEEKQVSDKSEQVKAEELIEKIIHIFYRNDTEANYQLQNLMDDLRKVIKEYKGIS